MPQDNDRDDLDSRFNRDANNDNRHASDDQGDADRVVEVNADEQPAEDSSSSDAPKKKRISFGVVAGGAVLASIFVYVVYAVMFAAPGAAPSTADTSSGGNLLAAPADAAPQTGAGGLLSGPATSAAPGASAVGAVDSQSLDGQSPLGGPNPAGLGAGGNSAEAVAQPAGMPASASAQEPAADVAVMRASLTQSATQIEQLKAEIAGLRQTNQEQGELLDKMKDRSAQSCATSNQAVKKTPPEKKVSSAPKKEVTAPAKVSQAKAKDPAEQRPPASVGTQMVLRAVVPSTGPNQRAWIWDGSNLISVAAGEYIGGHKVLSVTDSVVNTSGGKIFPGAAQ